MALFVYCKKQKKLVEVSKLPRRRNVSAQWPIHSEAMAVRTESIGEAKEIDRQHGVPTDYDGYGRPILRDRAHRKNYMAAHGFYDMDAGYGDRAPANYVASHYE